MVESTFDVPIAKVDNLLPICRTSDVLLEVGQDSIQIACVEDTKNEGRSIQIGTRDDG